MLREIDLEKISDGKLYRSTDLAKVGSGGCQGCSACCRGMGGSIVLDPYDIYQLSAGLHQSFEELLSYAVELQVIDGVILPNLKMTEEAEVCAFLNEKGRCRIHAFRPGFCRMFPLGRIYEGDSFQYFLQVHECKKELRTKVKISKWLEIPNLKRYEEYVCQWHGFLKRVQEILKGFSDPAVVKNICMYLLKTFFLSPYDPAQEFYGQFEERLKKAEKYFF